MIPWGVVVAGGAGSRFGRRKQFEPMRGRRVIDWSIDALASTCAGLVVVVPADRADDGFDGATTVVAGGDDRAASVRAGLDRLPDEATHVLVHDGARPLVSKAVVQRVLDALADGAVGVVPVVGVSDSLRTIDSRPVDRSGFVAVQTPQGFEVATLRAAHAAGRPATDDATLLHELGLEVTHVEGDVTNIKITEPHDLTVAEALFDAR